MAFHDLLHENNYDLYCHTITTSLGTGLVQLSQDVSINWAQCIPTTAGVCHFSKTGNIVTATFEAMHAQASSTDVLVSSVSIPTAYRPTANVYLSIMTINDLLGNYTGGLITVSSGGNFNVWHGTTLLTSKFTSGDNAGFPRTTVTWTTN